MSGPRRAPAPPPASATSLAATAPAGAVGAGRVCSSRPSPKGNARPSPAQPSWRSVHLLSAAQEAPRLWVSPCALPDRPQSASSSPWPACIAPSYIVGPIPDPGLIPRTSPHPPTAIHTTSLSQDARCWRFFRSWPALGVPEDRDPWVCGRE